MFFKSSFTGDKIYVQNFIYCWQKYIKVVYWSQFMRIWAKFSSNNLVMLRDTLKLNFRCQEAFFTFQKFQRSATASGHVADLVLGAPLSAASGRVAAADDGGGLASASDDGVHQLLGAVGELLEFEDAGRSKDKPNT